MTAGENGGKTKWQRDRETEIQRDGETKRQTDDETVTKRLRRRDGGAKGEGDIDTVG